MPNPAILSPAEKEQAGGRLELLPVSGPGAGGEGVLFQCLPPGRGLQVGLTGPVGMPALGTAQAELPPAGVVE